MLSQIDLLKESNAELRKDKDNVTHLSSQGAANLQKSLESLKEKDLKISRLQDALTKKDSVNYDNINKIENYSLPFTRGTLPSEPLTPSLLEPIIAVSSAVLTIILFFLYLFHVQT
jgi:hypothetical protein